MKTNILVALALLACGAGCVTLPRESRSDKANLGTPLPLSAGPITAELVEPANAHRMAEAVWDEMDRDQQKELLPAAKKDTSKR